MKTQKHRFIVFEGPSGVGKTTLTTKITEKLINQGFKAKRIDTSKSNEKCLLAQKIDAILNVNNPVDAKSINPVSRYMLMAARHIDIIENEIKPLLEDGYILIFDRFWWSSFVFGKLMGIDESILNPLADIYKAISKTSRPDIIFNISKKESFKNNVKDFEKYIKEYAELSEKEKNGFNIINIHNNKDLSTTVDEIYAHIVKNVLHNEMN